jgi:hypothetical protein
MAKGGQGGWPMAGSRALGDGRTDGKQGDRGEGKEGDGEGRRRGEGEGIDGPLEKKKPQGDSLGLE